VLYDYEIIVVAINYADNLEFDSTIIRANPAKIAIGIGYGCTSVADRS